MDAINFWFSPGIPNKLWFQFYFGTCPSLAVETASGIYQYLLSNHFSYPLFPDYISSFQMMLQLQFLGLVLSEGISGRLWYPAPFQGCLLCFSKMLLVTRLTAPRLAGNFSPRILVDFSCWVLFHFESVHLYGCSHHVFAVSFYFLPCYIYWEIIQLVRNQF